MRHAPSFGDVTARSAPAAHISGLNQPANRFPHRGARYVEALGEFAFARQFRPWLQLRTGDVLQQLVTQPVGEQSTREHSHRTTPSPPAPNPTPHRPARTSRCLHTHTHTD